MKNLKRNTAYLLSAMLILTSFPTRIFAQEQLTQSVLSTLLNTSKSTTSTGLEVEITTTGALNTTYSKYIGDGYEVEFNVINKWKDGFNAEFVVTNTGDKVVENWILECDLEHKITDIWDAEILTYEDNTYTIKNKGYNQDIQVGSSVTIGFKAECKEEVKMPTACNLIALEEQALEEGYTIDYRLINNWGQGFNSEISITNNMDKAIEDWILEFDFDVQIDRFYTAEILEHKGSHYVIKNLGYNANIEPGQTIILGFEGKPGDGKLELMNCTLKQLEQKIDYEKDSDEDGIPDFLEGMIGTNKNMTDSDGDGLTDWQEYYQTITDPTEGDSDNNGVLDSREDCDFDGLTNIEEITYGTNITKADTDSDGINDGDEVNKYYTEPLSRDTDEDGVSDGKEIELGTNLLVAEEKFKIKVEADTEDLVKVSVDVELKGEQVETLAVDKVDNNTFFPQTMPGYLGAAYDFSVEGTFEEAKISFEFDSNLIEGDNFEPVIYYFNEEEQVLEALQTEINGNIATAKTNHFSKYILVNRKVYEDSFEWVDTWEVDDYEGVEVVLVIDDSGSMSWNDRSNKRLEVSKKLVDDLPANSKIGIVKFESDNEVLTSLTADKMAANAYWTSSYFESSGGTSMYTGIQSGLNLYGDKAENMLRVMVVLSDGATSDEKLYSSVRSVANDKSVKIYTVGLGSFRSNLKMLASQTGGEFYEASNADALAEVYDEISQKIDIETDSDKDGISDYYEDNMVIFSGVKFKLDKNNPDTDGDGLLDGDEIVELKYEYNADRTKVKVTGKMESNPEVIDSDFDGIEDNEDYKKLDNTFKAKLHGADHRPVNVEFKVDYTDFFETNGTYNNDLAILSSLRAADVYDGTYITLEEGTSGGSDNELDFLEIFGLSDVESIKLNPNKYSVDKDDISQFVVGHRLVEYKNEEKEIFILNVRGTNGTIEEWSSNFDVGADTSEYYNATGHHPDWTNKQHHKGFDVASTRILEEFDSYLQRNNLNETEDKVIVVTGHSRGAAIANLLGKHFEDNRDYKAFTYTFACPNNTVDPKSSSYKTIFNIVNTDDMIPFLPLKKWGFNRYGTSKQLSVEDYYEDSNPFSNKEGTFEWYVEDDYNNDGGTKRTLDAMGKIADNRAGLYVIDRGKDGSVYENNWGHFTRKGAEQELAELKQKLENERLLKFCELSIHDGIILDHVEVTYCPAYLMQTLAHMACGDAPNHGLGRDVKGVYAAAKTSFVVSSGEIPGFSKIGGTKHPHLPLTYYIMVHNKLSKLN